METNSVKRGTMDHPKVNALMRTLDIPRYAAVGLLESIWHFTAEYAPSGDLTRYAGRELAERIDWKHDPDKLMQALIDTRWLDRTKRKAIVVHDWSQHADDSLHRTLARTRGTFCDGTFPKLTKLDQGERHAADTFYKRLRRKSRRKVKKPGSPRAAQEPPVGTCPALPSPASALAIASPSPEPEPEYGAAARAPSDETAEVSHSLDSARSGTSVSVSPTETDRRRLWTKFQAAVEPLWAGRGEKQRLSDDTDTRNIFQEIIWADDQPPPPDVFERCEAAVNLTKKAKKNGDKPMAWFKTMLRKELGSLEEVAPC